MDSDALETGSWVAPNDNKGLVVLLQGPVGSFFADLQLALEDNGYRTSKINFNSGDWFFGNFRNTLNYRRRPRDWESWFEAYAKREKPVAVLLFADQRYHHRIAIRVCRRLGIAVYCFEEGYVRPEYITFERDGNNAASRFVTEFEPDSSQPAAQIPQPQQILGNEFVKMAWAAVRYYVSLSFDFLFFPGYAHHRRRSILSEALCWGLNGMRRRRHALGHASRSLELLDKHDRRYFLLALQVHDDLQIRAHGKSWSMESVIENVCKSFAEHASARDLLVIKGHPFDRGHKNYARLIESAAAKLNMRDRIWHIDSAPLGLLLRHSRGLVTVNSTSGVLSLMRGIPVFALGDALYSNPALCNGGGLDELRKFWRKPFLPEEAVRDRFTNHLVRTTQINGSFYQSKYRARTLNGIIEKLNRELQRPQTEAIQALTFATMSMQSGGLSHETAANANSASGTGGAQTRQ
jgi:capsular polysaccharide export protein